MKFLINPDTNKQVTENTVMITFVNVVLGGAAQVSTNSFTLWLLSISPDGQEKLRMKTLEHYKTTLHSDLDNLNWKTIQNCHFLRSLL